MGTREEEEEPALLPKELAQLLRRYEGDARARLRRHEGVLTAFLRRYEGGACTAS